MKFPRPATLAAVALAAGLTLTACSSDDASEAVSNATSSAASAASNASDSVDPSNSDETSPASPDAGTAIPGPDGPLDDVDPAITAKYVGRGGPASSLGDATGPQTPVGDGFSVPFEGGTIFTSPETGAHVVQGEILRVYTEQGGPTGAFGFPTNDETPIPGGWSSTFTGGTITWTDETGQFAESLQPN